MKLRILALILTLALVMTGCSSPKPVQKSDSSDTVETSFEQTIYGEAAIINIAANGDGYYCLMSDISVNLYDGEPIGVVIDEPSLLSFQVSTAFDGGVYLFKLNEGDAAIECLTSVMEELEVKGETELADEIKEVLELFNCSGPIIGAST